MISIIFFAFILFLSLFIFYVLCENDFILIRKNVTLMALFNNIFIAMVAAFIGGRIFYILDTYNTFFVNPLIFFNYFKFSGFSLFGAFIGGIAIMIYLAKDTKALKRILDISALSFYPFIFFYMLSKPFTLQYLVIRVIVFLVFILLLVLFLNLHRNYLFKDGSIFFTVMIICANLNLLYNIFNFHKALILYFAFSDLISASIIVLSIVLLIKNERNFFLKS